MRPLVSHSAKGADTPASGCEGKQAFTDPTLAARIAHKQRSSGRKMRVYKCQWCKHFHIGSAEA